MAGEMKQLAESKIGMAILNNRIGELKDCMENGEDPLLKDRKGNTYLHYVCTIYRPHLIHILLTTTIDINAQNRHGNTALHVTALQDECGHVGDLLAAGIDPTIKNKDNKTAAEIKTKNKFWHSIHGKYQPGIFKAVADHDVDRVLELLHCWCKVDSVRKGQTLRQYAAALKFHDIVFLLDDHKPTMDAIYGVLEVNKTKLKAALKKSKCNINYLNHATSRQHILQYAIRLHDVELVTMICDAGADVNLPVLVNSYYWGPMFFEGINSNLPGEIVWKILKSKADFNLKDERGRNCLNFAMDKTNGTIPLDVLEFLLKKGAYIAERDETGATFRDVARFARRRDVVDLVDKFFVRILRNSDMTQLRRLARDGYDSLLIQHNYRDTYIYACGNETDDVLKFTEWLPQFEKHVNLLHYSIRHSDSVKVEELLSDAENDPEMLINARDKGGRSPLHLAILWGQWDIARSLVSRDDVDLTIKDNHLRTVYHYALAASAPPQFCSVLVEKGVDTEAVDCKWKKAEDYKNSDASCEWVEKEKKTSYGMFVELQCVDKYEELRKILKSKRKGLENFSEAIKHFKTCPVADFPKHLCPLMPAFIDLIFIALDYEKPDIAERLADLGADLIQTQKYNVEFEPETDTEDDESDKCSDQYPLVSAEVAMTPSDRARYLGYQELANKMDRKLLKQLSKGNQKIKKDLIDQITGQIPSVFLTEDY